MTIGMIDMEPTRWQEIETLFQEACDRPPAQRDMFLRARCDGDTDLLDEVRSLLESSARDPDFMDWSLPDRVNVQRDALTNDLAGRSIGGYRLVRFIAAGGMGAVYEAQQNNPRRNVALKIMRTISASPAAQRRFEMETQALARMKHPGVAQIYEAGTVEDALGPLMYFAMEYVAGARTIIDFASLRSLSRAQRLELFAQVCDAVHHGHQRGIIHRDLKPANILVGDDDPADGLKPVCPPTPQPKVIDFGIARLLDAEIAATRTLTPAMGTLAYMSPELVATADSDPLDIDIRSDVYSLGVVLYELLCDRLPHDVAGKPLTDVVRAIRDETPPRPSSIDRELRGDVEAIILKSLEKDRARRYQSAAELTDDIRRHLRHEPIAARPPTALYQLSRLARRHRALVIGAAVAVVGLVVGLLGAIWQAQRATTAQHDAQKQAQRAIEAQLEAQQQTRRAEDEAEAALGVSQSLVKLLRTLDPSEADKHFAEQSLLTSSPEATLDLAVGIIDGQLSGHPLAQATLFEQLGTVYANMGRFGQSQQLIDRAIALRRTNQGPKHIDVAGSLGSLAWLAYKQGDYPRALAVGLEAYDIALAAGGPDDLQTMRRLGDLRNTYIAMGDYVAAEDVARRWLARIERGIPSAALDTGLVAVAEVLRLRGKLDEAAGLYQRAYELCRERLGEADPDTGATLYWLAHTQCQRRDIAAIEALLVIAHEQSRLVQSLPENHPHRSGTLLLLGELEMARGDAEIAEPLLRECVARRLATLPEGHRLIAYARGVLGECLTARGRYAEAEPLLRDSLERMRRDYGEHSGWTVDARSRLAALCEATNRPDEARGLRATTITQRDAIH